MEDGGARHSSASRLADVDCAPAYGQHAAAAEALDELEAAQVAVDRRNSVAEAEDVCGAGARIGRPRSEAGAVGIAGFGKVGPVAHDPVSRTPGPSPLGPSSIR